MICGTIGFVVRHILIGMILKSGAKVRLQWAKHCAVSHGGWLGVMAFYCKHNRVLALPISLRWSFAATRTQAVTSLLIEKAKFDFPQHGTKPLFTAFQHTIRYAAF
jgi:hypothetical protein